VITIVDQYSGM